MKIYERVYDNPLNGDGSEKPNKLLGEFELLEGDMDDYSYVCYVRGPDRQVYKLVGREVSYGNGGTRHFLQKLEECPDVVAYLKLKL